MNPTKTTYQVRRVVKLKDFPNAVLITTDSYSDAVIEYENLVGQCLPGLTYHLVKITEEVLEPIV